MTAEVIVMNRGGVALAADSAVTIQAGNSSKVRDSALKLFMLSKHRPVGVMVYENSSLLGVPWETIIKLFREQFGRKQCANLAEYGEALIAFLEENDSLFPEKVQDHYYWKALETEYSQIQIRAWKKLADSRVYGIGDSSATQQTDKEWVEREIRRAERSWAEEAEASYFMEETARKETAREVAGRNSGKISELIQKAFGNWEIDSEHWNALQRIAKHVVVKDRPVGDLFTGLVIAGFGDEEHFPVVQHLRVGGIFNNRLKMCPGAVHAVSEDNPSEVLAFAYQDMVDGFLAGISPSVFKHLSNAAAFIRELPIRALDAVEGLAPEARHKAAEIIRRESARKASDFAQSMLQGAEERRKQIDLAVATLSLKELAQVASTLVGLSSFEHQMSLDLETVGGPVDVAVISRGDGFIWIDRKHYFQPELNSHFFRNYFDDGMKAEDAIADGDDDKEAPDEE